MVSPPAEPPPSSPAPAAADPIEAWLLAEGRHIPRTRDLVGALCQRLIAAGMPLWRIVLSVRTIHPQILSTVYYWVRDADSVVNVREKVAVEEWLASTRHFHLMRDHYDHSELVLAGM